MKPALVNIYRFAHRHLIWFLIGTYVLGALCPQLGLWIRGAPGVNGQSGWLLKVMLGLVLFNAGLGLDSRQLHRAARGWLVLGTAVAASVVVPLAFVLAAGLLLGRWCDPAMLYGVMTGMAVVAAMPVAGSSTAWSQNADGNLALSLGLVLLSTLLSPLTALVTLHAVAAITPAEPANALGPVSSQVAVVLLALWVLLPAAGGRLVGWIVGSARIERVKPYLKLANVVNLLVLNYANAALCLPAMVHRPDPAFLSLVTLVAVSLAVVAFSTAGWMARLFRVDEAQRASLFFGLGMKNNGAGLVLIATALAHHPEVMLPVIFYNLVQHLGAGLVDRFVLKSNREAETPQASCPGRRRGPE